MAPRFTPQSVCRLLLADRDISAGVYPMKNFIWPEEGLPAGMTRKQYEEKYTNWETLHNDDFEINGKDKVEVATKKQDTLKDIMDNRNKDNRNKDLSWLLNRRTTQKRGIKIIIIISNK